MNALDYREKPTKTPNGFACICLTHLQRNKAQRYIPILNLQNYIILTYIHNCGFVQKERRVSFGDLSVMQKRNFLYFFVT